MAEQGSGGRERPPSDGVYRRGLRRPVIFPGTKSGSLFSEVVTQAYCVRPDAVILKGIGSITGTVEQELVLNT